MTEWQSAEHAAAYLERADRVPHRSAGEAALLDELPPSVRLVLDLGSGDGRLLDLVLRARPAARGFALDFSPLMLEQLTLTSNPSLGWKSSTTISRCPCRLSARSMWWCRASRSITWFTTASDSCMKRSGRCWNREGCSVIWNTWHRHRSMGTTGFLTLWGLRLPKKIPRTSCWTSKRSWSGYAGSDFLMLTVTGNGASSLSSWAASSDRLLT